MDSWGLSLTCDTEARLAAGIAALQAFSQELEAAL